MANHCFYKFNQNVTLDEVEQAVRFYCKERLGDESLVVRDEEVIGVKIPVQSHNEAMALFWLKNAKTLEHRHPRFGFDFGVKIAEFVAWSLKSTHGTDEGIPYKINANNFLSKPLINFAQSLEFFGEPLSIKLLKKLIPEIKSVYMNEKNFLSPLNQKCAFYYKESQTQDDYSKKLTLKYNKVLKEIINNKKHDNGDIFYGNAIRAALSNANFKLVGDLIDQGFEVKDTVNYNEMNKPSYISDNYFKAIKMPLLCLMLNVVEHDTPNNEIYNIMSKLLQNGANIHEKDGRGLDTIDNFLLTKILNKNQISVIFQVLNDYVEPKKLKEKIKNSDLTEVKKESYLSFVKTFHAKTLKIK